MFLSGYLPNSTSLDSHNTQQERLNSKLVLLSPCCALFHWVLQSSHGSQVRKPQCQSLSLLVSCASTLTKMTTPNNIFPVCLPKLDEAKFSILSAYTSVDNVFQSYSFIQVVICRTTQFPSYSATTKLHSVTEPSDGCCVKPNYWFFQRQRRKVRQYWTSSLLERRVPHLMFERAESLQTHLIQQVTVSSLDQAQKHSFWIVWWTVITDASHELFGQWLFCTFVYAFTSSSVLQRWMICSAKSWTFCVICLVLNNTSSSQNNNACGWNNTWKKRSMVTKWAKISYVAFSYNGTMYLKQARSLIHFSNNLISWFSYHLPACL